jgi:hypothetical protein
MFRSNEQTRRGLDPLRIDLVEDESARKSGVKRPFALDWWLDPWGKIGETSAGTRPPIRY